MESVLTKVLLADADRAFTPDIQLDIWKSIGVGLGISAAAIATTSALISTSANAGGAASAGGAAAGAVSSSKLLTIALAVGTSATAIVATAAAIFGPVNAPSGNPSSTSQESIVMMEEYQAVSQMPEGVVLPEEPETAQGYRAMILLDQDVLRYSIGELPDPTQILLDAGALGYDAQGNLTIPTMVGYDQVDFSTPNDYYVYLEMTGEEGETIRKAVIIIVE